MIQPTQGRRIVWFVRVLAFLGLTMGVITVCLVGWTLRNVRAERTKALAEEEPLTRASAELRQLSVEARAEIQAALDESITQATQRNAAKSLDSLIQSQLVARPEPDVRATLTNLEVQASSLIAIFDLACAWRTNYLPVWEDLQADRSVGKLRDMISQLRNAVEEIEGRRRLADAINYRKWKNATNEEAVLLAHSILLEQGVQQSHDTTDFKNQLSEFARLVEVLGGEEQFDSLADLKDNKLKPVLDQLGRSVVLSATNQEFAEVLRPQTIEDLKIALFGRGYICDETHQTVQPGSGGLYMLRKKALFLRRERERLKSKLSEVFQEIETSNGNFAKSAQIRTSHLTLLMEKSLADGWRQMLICGIVCSLVFLWLAWFISRGVNSQVKALEQARAEAEAGRQTTQRLLQEQKAAADKLATAHQDLQVSEKRQELIFNSISEGIHWVDRNGKIVFENPAAARMLGWEIAQLVGQPAHAIMHHTRANGSPYPQNECNIYAGLTSNEVRHITDEVFLRKDGTSFPVEYTSTPVRSESGDNLGVVVVFSDISPRKRAEADLEEANKELLEISRKAGMAEVATGVLHNVGNVLNSVNVSANLLADNLAKSRASNLFKIATLLREHETDLGAYVTNDPKGKQIPAYLSQLDGLLSGERSLAAKELGELQKNISHIKDVITMQQSYAKVSGVRETVRVADLVEDALRMNSSALIRHDVQLLRDYASNLPTISVEKHKVLQILVNLIRNANHACDESGLTEKRLEVRITNENDRVSVAVADNGIGIPAENLKRIFNHGFTTKKDGHGFGLHSGALTAKELGGSLTAHSEGPGRGAVFTLELPLNIENGRSA